MDNYFEIFGVTAWPLKMGPIGCTETSVTTNLRCVTSQKSEDIIYTAAEAWNYTLFNWFYGEGINFDEFK